VGSSAENRQTDRQGGVKEKTVSILVNKNTRVVVQGITGKEGSFHASQCKAYGTKMVAGVTPGKAGQEVEGIPVFNTVADAVKKTDCDTSLIFVPPPFCADAILEAADAGVKLIICITEGIPVNDMVKVKRALHGRDVRLIGPNCPGVITVDEAKIGIMPGFIHKRVVLGAIVFMYVLAAELAKKWFYRRNSRAVLRKQV